MEADVDIYTAVANTLSVQVQVQTGADGAAARASVAATCAGVYLVQGSWWVDRVELNARSGR